LQGSTRLKENGSVLATNRGRRRLSGDCLSRVNNFLHSPSHLPAYM